MNDKVVNFEKFSIIAPVLIHDVYMYAQYINTVQVPCSEIAPKWCKSAKDI